MDEGPPVFRYRPQCLVPGCGSAVAYKVAAPWTDAAHWELKNYGTSCPEHAPALLERARDARARLVVMEGEALGPVALYRLVEGARDRELPLAVTDGPEGPIGPGPRTSPSGPGPH